MNDRILEIILEYLRDSYKNKIKFRSMNEIMTWIKKKTRYPKEFYITRTIMINSPYITGGHYNGFTEYWSLSELYLYESQI